MEDVLRAINKEENKVAFAPYVEEPSNDCRKLDMVTRFPFGIKVT